MSNVVSKNELQNTVSATGQLRKLGPVRFSEKGGKTKILFVGNSIAWHSYRPEIGWHGDWGMAATAQEKDFIHLTVSALEQKLGPVDWCLAQLAEWEQRYPDGTPLLEEKYAVARDFRPDIIVIRIGENFPKTLPFDEVFRAYFAHMIDFLVNGTDAKVVLTDSFWKNADRDARIREIAAEKGYTFCSIGDLEDNPEMMALNEYEHRGVRVHPSDLGMKGIAERIIAAIETVI